MNDTVITLVEKPVAAAVISMATVRTTITIGHKAQMASRDRADNKPLAGASPDTKSDCFCPNIDEALSRLD